MTLVVKRLKREQTAAPRACMTLEHCGLESDFVFIPESKITLFLHKHFFCLGNSLSCKSLRSGSISKCMPKLDVLPFHYPGIGHRDGKMREMALWGDPAWVLLFCKTLFPFTGAEGALVARPKS